MERKGDWLQTYTGRQFWPLDPRPEEVHLADIAHALAHQCRYSGHCKWFYSVAEHSILVSLSLPPELRLAGLLHDASEAYLVDVPRPIKPFLPEYLRAEEAVSAVIAERFGLPHPLPDEVKRVDAAILADEKAQLMADEPADWHLPEPPLGVNVRCLPPDQAERCFNRVAELLLMGDTELRALDKPVGVA